MTDQATLLVAPDPPPVDTTGMTRFYVLTVSDDLLDYRLVRTVPARDRDHALRLVFGKTPPLAVAVSEHQFRVKRPRFRPGFEDVDLPDPAANADDTTVGPCDDVQPSA